MRQAKASIVDNYIKNVRDKLIMRQAKASIIDQQV